MKTLKVSDCVQQPPTERVEERVPLRVFEEKGQLFTGYPMGGTVSGGRGGGVMREKNEMNALSAGTLV